jgi:hypothetical protein
MPVAKALFVPTIQSGDPTIVYALDFEPHREAL